MFIQNVIRHILQIFMIVIGMTGLSACGQQVGESETNKMQYETVIAGEIKNNMKEQAGDDVNVTEYALRNYKRRHSSLEIEIDDSNVRISVHDEIAYRQFLIMLDELENCDLLRLNVLGADIRVCLDDILAGHNIEYLYITGGTITARNPEALGSMSLDSMGIYRVSKVEEGILNHISSRYMEISLNDRYTGKLPTADLLNNMECDELIVMWGGEGGTGLLDISEPENKILKEWNQICSILSEKDRILENIYKEKNGEFSFTSYDFYEQGSDRKLYAEFISVKDVESGGTEYFDILKVPEERIAEIPGGIFLNDFHRMWFYDINFDGHDDFVYERRCDGCDENNVIFLWIPDKERFEYCGTAPRNFENSVSVKEHKAYYVYPDANAGPSIYSIYEYADGCFIRHSLEIEHRGDSLVYVYHREGEWVREQEFSYQKEDRTWHAVHEENGMTIEESMSEDLAELECAYFPEFTYIWQNRIR